MTRPWRALPGALVLGLQLTVAAAGGWLDASLIEAGDVPVHVEQAGDHPCDRGHDHQHCVVCRTLGLQALPAAPARGSAARATRSTAAPAATAPTVARPEGGAHRSRAPPTLPAIAR